MKALYKTKNGQLQFEVEGKEQKEIFEQIAAIQDVFDENTCMLCGKTNLQFVDRIVEDNHFYEMQCKSCGGRLSFSQNKKGGSLYAVRKLKDGRAATIKDEPPFDWSTKGWYKYDKTKQATATKSNKK
jgi:transcription elongation factor Elf1